jgi:hypothetical protein
MKMQLVRGLTRMNADPDNPRESAFIRAPFSHSGNMPVGADNHENAVGTRIDADER